MGIPEVLYYRSMMCFIDRNQSTYWSDMNKERHLLQIEGVREAAVVGYPDKRLNEVAVAFVRRASDTSVQASEVIDSFTGRIASFKIPRHVIFVDELPMTSSGKIRKVELRERALEVLGKP